MHKKTAIQAMLNPTTLVISLIFLLDNITVQGLGFFLPTIIRTLFPGRSTVEIQLRTVSVGSLTSVSGLWLRR